MDFFHRLYHAVIAAKEQLFPPPPQIEAQFMIQELVHEETGEPRLLVFAAAGDRSFCFLENEFAVINIPDQPDGLKSWALADSPPYEGELPEL